jgi:hypothetical protein
MGCPAGWNQKIYDDPGFSILSLEHAMFITVFARNSDGSRWRHNTKEKLQVVQVVKCHP